MVVVVVVMVGKAKAKEKEKEKEKWCGIWMCGGRCRWWMDGTRRRIQDGKWTPVNKRRRLSCRAC